MLMSLRILIGFLFLILFTQFQMELSFMEVNIPITGQSFGVLLVPYVLGTKEGMITILLYLILGLLGMPIFAEGSSGWASFTSNSGGYLVGFLVGGMFSGCVSGKFENTIWASLSAMFFGTFLILLFGVLKLSLTLGLSKAIVYGFIRLKIKRTNLNFYNCKKVW